VAALDLGGSTGGSSASNSNSTSSSKGRIHPRVRANLLGGTTVKADAVANARVTTGLLNTKANLNVLANGQVLGVGVSIGGASTGGGGGRGGGAARRARRCEQRPSAGTEGPVSILSGIDR
jgi:hypothetical protein